MGCTLVKKFMGKYKGEGLREKGEGVDTLSPSPIAHSPSLKAFSLVELAIVITIMGLIIAATIAGNSLLNTSKLRGVISEIEGYKSAIDSFQQQYNALPGDMNNATSFWTTAQNGGTAVANGDGNGQIGITGWQDYTETYYAWNHLTLSKFVPGTFSGSSSVPAVPGLQVPASKYLEMVGFAIRYDGGPWGYTDALGRQFANNYIYVGAADSTTLSLGQDVFLAVDAAYLDSKMDDGRPNYGKVLGGHWYGTGTCTSGTGANMVYAKSQVKAGCILVIATQ